jgi:hypothetical protein
MAADEVIAKITAIGTVTYTPESKALIDAARTAYDALTADQQALVTNYSTLTDAETTYAAAEETAYTEGVELTKNPDGTWSLAATPAFDVELEVEYFPVATLTAEPAAAVGLEVGTVADLLTPGTSTEGTLSYAIGESDTEAPTTGWSDAIPTTEGLTAGTVNVWYKVVGDAEHSDSQPQCIAVAILPQLGDVNADGRVTPADAIMILYHYFEVAQSGFFEEVADMNGDNEITPADAIEVLYKYFRTTDEGSNNNARPVRPITNGGQEPE